MPKGTVTPYVSHPRHVRVLIDERPQSYIDIQCSPGTDAPLAIGNPDDGWVLIDQEGVDLIRKRFGWDGKYTAEDTRKAYADGWDANVAAATEHGRNEYERGVHDGHAAGSRDYHDKLANAVYERKELSRRLSVIQSAANGNL